MGRIHTGRRLKHMPTMPASRLVHVEHVMGTVVSLDARNGVEDGLAPAIEWLREVDARFSTYRADSEVRRLDRGELLHRDASPDTRWVLERCAALFVETGGGFDGLGTEGVDRNQGALSSLAVVSALQNAQRFSTVAE